MVKKVKSFGQFLTVWPLGNPPEIEVSFAKNHRTLDVNSFLNKEKVFDYRR